MEGSQPAILFRDETSVGSNFSQKAGCKFCTKPGRRASWTAVSVLLVKKQANLTASDHRVRKQIEISGQMHVSLSQGGEDTADTGGSYGLAAGFENTSTALSPDDSFRQDCKSRL